MQFDARAAKQLQAGKHLTVDGCPGLRLEATKSTRSWTYRYKSPADGRMKQVKIGDWPKLSLAAAVVQWEALRQSRGDGVDVGAERKRTRAVEAGNATARVDGYSVKALCKDYLTGHIERHRKTKGANEVARMFRTMLGAIENLQAASLTRSQAFDLLESHAGIPVQAARIRAELGAAWDYALDAGRLPENTPNWWRMVMRGRLKSKGRTIAGKKVKAKRTLSAGEITTLIPWLPNFSRTVCDALTLYMWTDTRGAEIVGIEGREVTEEEDGLWWTIPKAKTKNERIEDATDLRVPLVGRAETIVRRRKALHGDGYLFPQAKEPTKHIEQKVIQTAVHFHQPYSKTRPKYERPRLPVTHWAPHDLRRTIRTMLPSLGCPEDVAEAILGHVQQGIKGVYNLYTYDAERRRWLTRVSDRLEELAAGH